jgi:hypothetical protein
MTFGVPGESSGSAFEREIGDYLGIEQEKEKNKEQDHVHYIVICVLGEHFAKHFTGVLNCSPTLVKECIDSDSCMYGF